ncbi:MAG: hypothetical protein CXR30_08015 [Geobacter sp.]|nr:MAG: hypothetical protein CXR30_08015 [Geobacter sp.]
MVLGYNHNVMYKGEVYHVQTEDSGIANPHITTLLYKGGVILCSKKTSYADILKMDNLEVVLVELMKEQHKDIMRRLKAGEFDERACSIPASVVEVPDIAAPVPVGNPVADLFSLSSAPRQTASGSDISLLFEMPAAKETTVPKDKPKSNNIKPKDVVSLDDAILTFFGANGEK